MGVCYSVDLTIFPKNTLDCTAALGAYLKQFFFDFTFKSETLEELLEILLGKKRKYSNFKKHSENYYSSDFEACYSWEKILSDSFRTMCPYLEEGSTITIGLDDNVYTISLKKESIVDGRKMLIRNLTEKDLVEAGNLDMESGFCVGQWLEDLQESESADNCYGIFYENEMVGYCSLGYADGILDVPVLPDARLLSDVFVSKAWRHLQFATNMIKDVLDIADGNNIYLMLLDDELKDFYNYFGFEEVAGTDNVMVRYA